MAAGAASSGSGTPAHRALAWSGRMKVTREPRIGPKHRSPCQARGLSTVPHPERSASPTCPSPGWLVTAATSSSRPRTAPSSASRTTARRISISLGPSPNQRTQLGRSQDRPAANNDRKVPPSSGVSRCRVPRIAHVLMRRPSESARPTSTGDEAARRTRMARSADEATCACTPHSRRTTSGTDWRVTGSSSCRCRRQARACGQLTFSVMA